MKEHEDDLGPSSVKESVVVVDSTTADEKLGGGEGEIEGFCGERDGEDMMVDVVGVDGHGGKGGSDGSVKVWSEKELETRDVDMEDVGGSGGEVRDVSVESRVLTSEKVEVVTSEEGVGRSVEVSQEVFRDNVVTAVTTGDGIGVGESNMVVELSSGEPQVVGGEIDVIDNEKGSRTGLTEEIVERPMESAQEVADGDQVMDEKTGKEAEALDSSKTLESLTTTANLGSGDVTEVVLEEGLVVEDEAPDSVSVDPSLAHQSLSTEVVKAGMVDGSVHVNTEGLGQQAENDMMRKEESLHPTIEVVKSGNLDCTVEQQLVNVKPIDESLESHATPCGDLTSSADTTQPSGGGGVRIEDKVSLHSNLEATSEHHLSEIFGDDRRGSKVSATSVEHSEVAAAIDTKVSDVVSREQISRGGEVLTINNEHVYASGKNIDDVDVEGSTDKAVDESSKIDSTACTEADEVATCTEVGEVAKTGEMHGFQVSSEDFPGVYRETIHVDDNERGAPSADPEFSFEEAHVDRGEDAGMDIDEVLGWKDEIPGIDAFSGRVSCPETNQHFNIDVEQGLLKSSSEPVLIGRQEEDPEFRKPIVYERRTHVEVSFYDAFGGISSPEGKDENLKIKTLRGNSDEDDRSVQEEEQNVALHSTDPPTVEDTMNEEPSTLAHLDTVDGGNHRLEAHSNEVKDGSAADKETEAVEHGSEAEQSTGIDEDISEPHKNATSVSLHQTCYFQPPENEGEFCVSDLVWGKIRSHPWWPGQIFDPVDASKKAMKYHKKNRFLVAYFGDGTFAWNDSTVLKPFRAKFPRIEHKHSNSDAFRNAVSCALEEVSRRVELGLACPCISQDVYEKIEHQVVENGGIRQESSRRHGVDNSAGVNSFEPDKLVDYVRLLALFPYGEDDKLELAIAKAQLSSYGQYKGHRQLPEFLFCGDLLEGVDDASILGKDAVNGNIAANSASSHGAKKRKALDSVSNGSVKRQNLHPEKVPIALTPTPTPTPTSKPSFKVGECIQRVASQLTGVPSVPKSSSDKNVEHANQPARFKVSVQSLENSERGRMIAPGDQASLAEMLSQLHLAAQNPMEGYSFLNSIIPFFSSYRSFNWSKSIRPILSPAVTRKRKISNENDPERFEFDDVNDSYWTDRIIQSHSEEQLLQDNQNGGGEYQLQTYELDKPVKPSRRSNKKRFFNSNHESEAEEQSELVELRRQNLATEVILKFTEGVYFTSEMNLNKMFRRFGPLMESETEVDRQSGRARVVFKRCSDAEVAHSSAGKFNIFGSIDVNYELNYTPLVSYKPLPLPILQDPEDAT